MAGAASYSSSPPSEESRPEKDSLLAFQGALVFPLPEGRSIASLAWAGLSPSDESDLDALSPSESTASRRRYLARRHPHSATGGAFAGLAESMTPKEAERT